MPAPRHAYRLSTRLIALILLGASLLPSVQHVCRMTEMASVASCCPEDAVDAHAAHRGHTGAPDTPPATDPPCSGPTDPCCAMQAADSSTFRLVGDAAGRVAHAGVLPPALDVLPAASRISRALNWFDSGPPLPPSRPLHLLYSLFLN
ncbi:MAG: hypothetical protein R2834_12370 [Rhodothermales bacterium]